MFFWFYVRKGYLTWYELLQHRRAVVKCSESLTRLLDDNSLKDPRASKSNNAGTPFPPLNLVFEVVYLRLSVQIASANCSQTVQLLSDESCGFENCYCVQEKALVPESIVWSIIFFSWSNHLLPSNPSILYPSSYNYSLTGVKVISLSFSLFALTDKLALSFIYSLNLNECVVIFMGLISIKIN